MEGNFLTTEEFQNKFKIKINYLHYLQLIKKAATIEVPLQEFLNKAKLSSSVIPTQDLTEMGCKNYYKILNQDCITEPTGIKNWKNNYPHYFKDWGKNFRLYIKPQRIIN